MTFKVSAHPLNSGASVKISRPADGNLLFQWPGFCLVLFWMLSQYRRNLTRRYFFFFFEEREKWSIRVHIGKKISVIHAMLERSMVVF